MSSLTEQVVLPHSNSSVGTQKGVFKKALAWPHGVQLSAQPSTPVPLRPLMWRIQTFSLGGGTAAGARIETPKTPRWVGWCVWGNLSIFHLTLRCPTPNWKIIFSDVTRVGVTRGGNCVTPISFPKKLTPF